MMALVDQQTASQQGHADYGLYKLAHSESLSQCNGSATSGLSASTCIFNDVTSGNNAVPGEVGSSYQSTVGYDFASGFRSGQRANLANKWSSVRFAATTTTLSFSPGNNITHGSPVPINITVAANGGGTPTGSVALVAYLDQGLKFQLVLGFFR